MVKVTDIADSLEAENQRRLGVRKEQNVAQVQADNHTATLQTIQEGIQALINFQAQHEPRVSVTNQKLPTSIKTPDVKGVVDSLKSIEGILKTPEEDDTRLLEAIKTLDANVKKLPSLIEIPEAPEPVESVTVKNQPDYKPDFKALNDTLAKIDVKPVVKLSEKPDDYTPVINALQDVQKAISNIKLPSMPVTNISPIVEAVNSLQETINNLKFPVPNYILPFKDVNGKATQASLDDNGNIQKTQYAAFQFDPNDLVPIYIGKNVDPNATDSDTRWQVYKFTYSGSNVTKIVKKVGPWAGRASL